MADERLLAPIRRFWSQSEVEEAYAKIFAAYGARLDSVTVIVGKSSEAESAQGQVVIEGSDYLVWMEALEFRLSELESSDTGVGPVVATEHVNFGRRYTRT
jgi:hypothetical protein